MTLDGETGSAITVKPGTNITCSANGYPIPQVYFKKSYNTTVFRAVSAEPDKVVVQSLRDVVVATLTCLAKNELGEATKSFTITVDGEFYIALHCALRYTYFYNCGIYILRNKCVCFGRTLSYFWCFVE